MNTIDLIILVAVLIGLVRGVITGGIRQVFSFAGIFLAFIIAAKANASIGAFIAEAVRAGVQSVPHGQTEAARSIGLKENRIMSLTPS